MDFYWVAYQKGSFPVKEPYRCPIQADQRAAALRAQVWIAHVIPPAPSADLQRLLEDSIEIPAPRNCPA